MQFDVERGLPKHLAIIMDGNGRWAQGRGHNRFFGHVRGAVVAKSTIERCAKLGIENLTLFTFSTENWFRPQIEVSFLMTLLARRLKRETATLIDNNIRFHCIGDLKKLPENVRAQVSETLRRTAHCTGMRLTFALSYGGRQELVGAFKSLAERVQAGEIRPEDVGETEIAQALASSFLPDPDLIIRTSGEFRLSNFFLWQAAYSEIYVCPKPWPEFDHQELATALAVYGQRERRFGRVKPLAEPVP